MSNNPATSRRRFLRTALVTAGAGLAVLACSASGGPSPAPTPTAAAKPTEPPKPAAPAAPAAPPAAAPAASPAAKPAASPSPSPSPAAAAPGVPKDLMTFQYAIPSINGFHVPVLIGQDKQLFEKRGVKLDMVFMASGVAMGQAMLGGSILASAQTATVAWTMAKQSDTKGIFGVFVSNPYSVMTKQDITELSQLKGKIIGASAVKIGGDIEGVRLILGHNKLTDGVDYTVVVAGSVQDRVGALGNNSVQAIGQLEPQTTWMKEQGYRELARASDIPALRLTLGSVMTAKASEFKSKDELFLRFTRGYLDALEWMYDPKNKEAFIEAIIRIFKVGPGPATALYDRNLVEVGVYPRDARVTEANVKASIEALKLLGDPPPDNPMAIFDFNLLERALKMG